MEEFYIDKSLNSIYEHLLSEQVEYLNNMEKALHSNLKNDFDLIVNVYRLYKSSSVGIENFSNEFMVDSFIFVQGLTFFEFINKFFGFSRSYTYRLLQIAEKFINIGSRGAATFRTNELKDYSISKLQELLPLTVEQINQAFKFKKLTYKSTLFEIREVVKRIKLEADKKSPKTNKSKQVKIKKLGPGEKCTFKVALPKEEYDFVIAQILNSDISFDEYFISLIREQM